MRRGLKLYQPSQFRHWRRGAGMEHAPGKKGGSNSEQSLSSHSQLGSQGPSDNLKTAEAPVQVWGTNAACLPGRETAKLTLLCPIRVKSMPQVQIPGQSLLFVRVSSSLRLRNRRVWLSAQKLKQAGKGKARKSLYHCITPSSVKALTSCISFSWQCPGCAHLTLQPRSAELSLSHISWVFLLSFVCFLSHRDIKQAMHPEKCFLLIY